MKVHLMLLVVLLVNTGCIKYKKTYKPAGEPVGDEAAPEGDESSSEGDSGSDEGGSEDTGLTGQNLLETLVPKSSGFEVSVNLNGKLSKTKKIDIAKGEATILVSNLPAIQSGQMKLEIFDGEALQFSTRLSNVNVASNKDLRVVLNNCRTKAKSDPNDKEVTCNWSAEQPIN